MTCWSHWKSSASPRARVPSAKIIAVTGSAGKTTTKEALRHVLSAVGKVHASAQSFNNHWGVPLTLARMPADCDYAVFEIGMNHPGEIRPLVKMVRPHVAIVTLIAAAHLGFFRNLDEIAKAKAEIFEGMEPGRCGDPQPRRFALEASRQDGARRRRRARLRLRRERALDLQAGQMRTACRPFRRSPPGSAAVMSTARVGVPGRHMVQNVLAVLGAAHLVGADLDRVASALADLSAERGRGKRHVLRHPKRADHADRRELQRQPGLDERGAWRCSTRRRCRATGRRIAVLGDMLELGEPFGEAACRACRSDRRHRDAHGLSRRPGNAGAGRQLARRDQDGISRRRRGFETGAAAGIEAGRCGHDQIVERHRFFEAGRCAARQVSGASHNQ